MQALRNVRKKKVEPKKEEETKEETKKDEEKKEEGESNSTQEGDQLTLKKTNSKDLAIIRKRKAGARRKAGEERDIRLQGEWNDFEEIPGIKIEFPDPKVIASFLVTITPSEGLWTGAKYQFKCDIPVDYPHKAPSVECQTVPIYHPNINFEGAVCLNILREGWKPTFGVTTVLFGLMHLFSAPNPYDPLPNRGNLPKEMEAAALMLKDSKAFESLVARTLKGGYITELTKNFPKLR